MTMGVLRVGSCCSLSSALLTTALFPPEINITKDSHSRSIRHLTPDFSLHQSSTSLLPYTSTQNLPGQNHNEEDQSMAPPLKLAASPPHPPHCRSDEVSRVRSTSPRDGLPSSPPITPPPPLHIRPLHHSPLSPPRLLRLHCHPPPGASADPPFTRRRG